MRALLILGVIAAGGYYAYRKGLLPEAQPVADWVGTIFPGASILPEEDWLGKALEWADEGDEVREQSGGRVVPILGEDETVAVNKYEAALRSNWGAVQPWARSNLGWAAAIMMTENGPINPKLSGDNGTSHGVYQVKVATAETCARAGYDDYPPTKATLQTLAGGIYYGTAEMERLSRMGKGLDWTIKAYNGGAGWEQMDAAYRKGREAYLVKVKQNFVKLYGKDMA